MKDYLVFTGLLVHVLLIHGDASSTRIQSLPLELGFDPKNINKSSVSSHNKTVVCMLDAWSHWRDGEGTFSISDIDPTLCSQIVYRNAGINNETFQIKVNDPHLAESLGWYRQIVALGKIHHNLKVLLSIGGWSEGSFTFSKVAADYQKRKAFVDSVLRILQQYNFHGIDLAWEYPAWISRGGTSQDKDNLPLLMRDLKNGLGKDYIISLTVAGDTHFATPAYNIKALASLVDQFNVRSFDFAGGWNDQTYHHSALRDLESRQSVVNSVNYYMENGVPPEKLVVGIPFYGRTFRLKNDETVISNSRGNDAMLKMSGLEQPTNGSFAGNWVPDTLLMGYHEICHEISNTDGWQTYFDNSCMVPFARHGQRWVTFDNPESVNSKVSFALQKKLKGVMVWAIDTDDFKGTACSQGSTDNNYESDIKPIVVTYPLLRTVNYALGGHHEAATEMQDSNSDGEFKNGNDNRIRTGFHENHNKGLKLKVKEDPSSCGFIQGNWRLITVFLFFTAIITSSMRI